MKKTQDSSKNFTLPSEGYVRLPTILKVFPVGKSTFWKRVADGEFPQPVKLGSRTSAWRVADVRKMIASYDDQAKEEAQ
jgi:prophage regulatory protein